MIKPTYPLCYKCGTKVKNLTFVLRNGAIEFIVSCHGATEKTSILMSDLPNIISIQPGVAFKND